jgi:hypothetical protein
LLESVLAAVEDVVAFWAGCVGEEQPDPSKIIRLVALARCLVLRAKREGVSCIRRLVEEQFVCPK